MKIAIISDIHGNLDALKQVLTKSQQLGAQKLYFLGDYAMAGPELNETINFLKELAKKDCCKLIQGNTDEMIVKGDFKTGAYIPPNNIMANALKYAQKNISKENKEFLAKLPEKKSIEIGNIKMLLTHGSPRKNNENIFPGRPIKEITPMIEGVEEDIIFCGHTHLPAGYQIEKKTVVNVGSAGRPFTENQKVCFVLIEIINPETKELQIEHIFVKYDPSESAKKLALQKFDGAKVLAEMLIKSSSK